MPAHPLFSRLSRQLEDAKDEQKKLLEGHAVSLRAKKETPGLYSEYMHLGAIGAGIASIYGVLEQIMESIVSEIDGMRVGGDSYHEKLINQLAVAVDKVRDALLSKELAKELQELRGFRHVVRHNYASRLDYEKLMRNLERTKMVLRHFEIEYHKLRKSMEAPEPEPSIPRRKLKKG